MYIRHTGDHLGDVRLFIAIADLGSLTIAANRFGISVPAASVRLAKLERSLGVKLFNRSTKRFLLTEEGRSYLKECILALGILDDAELRIRSNQKSTAGSIKISVATDFGRKYVSGWIDDFLLMHPGIRISLVLDDSFSDILKDEIDVAIRFGRPTESSLVVKRLAKNHRVLCASKEYLEKNGEPQSPMDLDKHKFIVLATRKFLLDEYYFEYENEKITYKPSPDNIWVVNDGELATKWAILGRGIVRKTIWDAVDSINSGDLKIVLPNYILKEEGVFSVRHYNKHLSKRVRLFLDFLERKFNEESKKIEEYLL